MKHQSLMEISYGIAPMDGLEIPKEKINSLVSKLLKMQEVIYIDSSQKGKTIEITIKYYCSGESCGRAIDDLKENIKDDSTYKTSFIQARYIQGG